MTTAKKTASNSWDALATQCAKIDGIRILLHGLAGTGKSSTAPRGSIRTTLSGSSLPADLIGSIGLKGGDTVSVDGCAAIAFKEGRVLVIDEVDHASPEVTSTLHALCDDHKLATLRLPSGEVITPNKGYGVLCTMNGAPQDLSPAFLDRFDVIIECVTPSQGALNTLPAHAHAFAVRLYESKAKARGATAPVELSLRGLQRIERLRAAGIAQCDLAQATGLSAADIEAYATACAVGA